MMQKQLSLFQALQRLSTGSNLMVTSHNRSLLTMQNKLSKHFSQQIKSSRFIQNSSRNFARSSRGAGNPKDFYNELGVERNSDQNEIK